MCSPSAEGGTRKDSLLWVWKFFHVDLSITIKSYQFVGNKYSASDFFEETKKYSKLLLDTL